MKRKTTKANLFMLAIVVVPQVLSVMLGVAQVFVQIPLWFLLMLGELSILLCIALYAIFARKTIKEIFPLRKMKISTWLWSFLLSICVMPAVTVVNLLSQFFTTNAVSDMMAQVYELPFIVLFVVIAIMPAIIEEIGFRGILLQNYRKNGVLLGILLSAFFFGLMHGNLNQFCYATVIGIIAALMVEATGNILSSALLHFIINGTNVAMLGISALLSGSSLAELYEQELVQVEEVGQTLILLGSLMVYLPIGIVGSVAGYFVFRQLCRSTGRWEYVKAIFHNRIELPEKEKTVDVWFILATIGGIAIIVLNEILL